MKLPRVTWVTLGGFVIDGWEDLWYNDKKVFSTPNRIQIRTTIQVNVQKHSGKQVNI